MTEFGEGAENTAETADLYSRQDRDVSFRRVEMSLPEWFVVEAAVEDEFSRRKALGELEKGSTAIHDTMIWGLVGKLDKMHKDAMEAGNLENISTATIRVSPEEEKIISESLKSNINSFQGRAINRLRSELVYSIFRSKYLEASKKLREKRK